MEVMILEGAQPIGRVKVEADGLFWRFFCQIEQDLGHVRRIFVLDAMNSHYLGIPNAAGELNARIPQSHLPNGIDGAVATAFPRGAWSPWRGVLDGVAVETAFVRHMAQGIEVALTPEEMVKFPAWASEFQTEKVNDVELAVLKLNADGHLPLIKRESRGNENEENAIDPVDSWLPADAPADDGFCEQGREADRADL